MFFYAAAEFVWGFFVADAVHLVIGGVIAMVFQLVTLWAHWHIRKQLKKEPPAILQVGRPDSSWAGPAKKSRPHWQNTLFAGGGVSMKAAPDHSAGTRLPRKTSSDFSSKASSDAAQQRAVREATSNSGQMLVHELYAAGC